MRAFFSTPQKINLGWTLNRWSGSTIVLKNVLNKKRKIKHVASKWKTFVIILQAFAFDKTYHLVLKDSALVQPESAPSVHLRVHFFKVYFFASCFPTIPLNRARLKYGTMKLKGLWKDHMDDWAWCHIYLLRPSGSLLVHAEYAHWVYLTLHFLCCN